MTRHIDHPDDSGHQVFPPVVDKRLHEAKKGLASLLES